MKSAKKFPRWHVAMFPYRVPPGSKELGFMAYAVSILRFEGDEPCWENAVDVYFAGPDAYPEEIDGLNEFPGLIMRAIRELGLEVRPNV